jgi:hypothetical protein
LVLIKIVSALEKKLLSRRPMSTLVEQGIMPEYKTSPSLHLQKTKLERARMGDMLKYRISHRPAKADLVHRHILEVNIKCKSKFNTKSSPSPDNGLLVFLRRMVPS